MVFFFKLKSFLLFSLFISSKSLLFTLSLNVLVVILNELLFPSSLDSCSFLLISSTSSKNINFIILLIPFNNLLLIIFTFIIFNKYFLK